jgi:hypothetical protein
MCSDISIADVHADPKVTMSPIHEPVNMRGVLGCQLPQVLNIW